MEIIIGILSTGLFASIGFAFQMNAKVNVLESKQEDLLLLINSKFDEVNRRLDRIEKSFNGYLKH